MGWTEKTGVLWKVSSSQGDPIVRSERGGLSGQSHHSHVTSLPGPGPAAQSVTVSSPFAEVAGQGTWNAEISGTTN